MTIYCGDILSEINGFVVYITDPRGEILVSSSDIGTDVIACITFRLI